MPTNYFSSYDGMKVMAEVDSAGNNIAGSLGSINSKIPGEASSSNQLVTKSELAEFGYSVADGDPTTGEPVVAGDKSPHMVYLVKDDDAPGDDKYFEWIWAAQDTDPVTYAWEKIGETSFELDIDTETFRTSILIDQNTPLLVDDDTPMVENDDVTLVKAVNGNEIIARRAREDVNGESLELRVENGKVSGIGGKDLVQPDLTPYALSADLSTVAFSGSYNDLDDKPSIPAAQIQADWNQTDTEAPDYVKNKPDYDDVVFVSYGTGTLDEISTAVNAGKSVIVSRGISGRIYYAKLSQYGFGSYYFTCVDGNTAMTWSISPDAGTGTWASTSVTIPDAQIPADWEQTTTTAKDYIKNKPDIEVYTTAYIDSLPWTAVIGGREYSVIKIGNQLWLAENLDWKFDVNGSQIPIGQSGQPTTPAAWYYNNDEATYGIDGTYKCGLLYNWYAAKYLDDNKATLLPDGWHVPTITEYDSLISSVGGESTAGTKLKATNNSITSNWPNEWGGMDESGFNGLPSGAYWGQFGNIGTSTNFWFSTSYSSSLAYDMWIGTGASTLLSNSHGKAGGFSVRLVKDAT